MIKFTELICQIDDFSDDLVAFKEKSEPDTEDMWVELFYIEDAVKNNLPDGVKYVLEVSLIKEVIDVWSLWRGGKTPTQLDKVNAVLYFIKNDAYLPEE